MILSFFASVFARVGAGLLAVVCPVLNFVSIEQPSCIPPVATSTEVEAVLQEQSTTTVPVEPAPVAVAVTPPVVVTPPPAKPAVVVTAAPPPYVPPYVPPPVSQNITVGSTTIAVGSIPLLTGGTAHAGQTMSVSFLQINNGGTAYAHLTGFELTQNGLGSTDVIIGLSTVDDRGGSRGLAGGTEGFVVFHNGKGFAPTDAYLAPGEMRLFTVKAILSSNGVSAPQELKLDVTAVDTTASVLATFPIRGTTWIVSP